MTPGNLTPTRTLAAIYRAAELSDAPAEDLAWIFETHSAPDRMQRLEDLHESWTASRTAATCQSDASEHVAPVVSLFGGEVLA